MNKSQRQQTAGHTPQPSHALAHSKQVDGVESFLPMMMLMGMWGGSRALQKAQGGIPGLGGMNPPPAAGNPTRPQNGSRGGRLWGIPGMGSQMGQGGNLWGNPGMGSQMGQGGNLWGNPGMGSQMGQGGNLWGIPGMGSQAGQGGGLWGAGNPWWMNFQGGSRPNGFSGTRWPFFF
ncbi:hypothetical protein D2Q93_15315 [Alicyclobacillaceae bacterium I2511]|nr:hypothetical protein D2Q93_15315 [Alicyclobacillaceae bacterium I2511]